MSGSCRGLVAVQCGAVRSKFHNCLGAGTQGHNPRPGPVYSGGGYTPVSTAIAAFRAEEAKMSDPEASGLARLLTEYPDLVNDVSTGGALPLHTCGMSRDNQHATAFIIARGGDIEALDTYGYTPLHRMASNNLAVGARALLEAGADPNGLTKTKVAGASRRAETPLNVALQSDARDVVAVLREFGSFRQQNAATAVSSVNVLAAGYAAVIGRYVARDAAEVPSGFAAVCRDNAWPVEDTWRRLNGGEEGRWYAHESNDSYIYFNAGDSMWWIDGPDGLGAYKAPGPSWTPPCSQIVWQSLRDSATGPGPTLSVVREEA